MVTRNILISDLSGDDDAVTTKLGYGGQWYELDMTTPEQEELEALLAPYISASRISLATPKPRVVPVTTPEEREDIRDWGREQGFDLASRGKIPNKVFQAYQAAHERTS